MKAIRIHQFGDPDVMKLEEVPDPTPGESRQVVVKVAAAGVNPVDTYVRTGTYAMKPDLPYTPGGEGAGTIEQVNAEVRNFKVGDRVFFLGSAAGRLAGGYAERVVCNETSVYPLPNNIDLKAGAAVPVAYATAYRALFDRGKADAGESVLVHGATGGVGLAAVQLAALYGMTVYGTGGTTHGRQLVLDNGASAVFDHHARDYADRIKEATGGRGVDVVIEMLANVNLDRDLDLLAEGGAVTVVGSRGRVEIDPRKLMGKEGSVSGMTLWGGGEMALRRAFAAIAAGLKAGALRPVVGEAFGLSQAADAHRRVMEDGSRGKIILVP